MVSYHSIAYHLTDSNLSYPLAFVFLFCFCFFLYAVLYKQAHKQTSPKESNYTMSSRILNRKDSWENDGIHHPSPLLSGESRPMKLIR